MRGKTRDRTDNRTLNGPKQVGREPINTEGRKSEVLLEWDKDYKVRGLVGEGVERTVKWRLSVLFTPSDPVLSFRSDVQHSRLHRILQYRTLQVYLSSVPMLIK